MTLDELNVSPYSEAEEAIIKCCGSLSWAAKVLAARPFSHSGELLARAEQVWFAASREDWLEAFSKHPKIGDRSGGKWSAQEQRGMNGAAAEVAHEMRELNVEYEKTFGWIFLICATGKSAEEMMSELKNRMTNDPETELRIAVEEQAQILHLRLRKLLSE